MSTDSESTESDAIGYYGRPQFKLSYYSHSINAYGFKTFKTRHAAIGERAKLRRTGKGERFRLTYREDYDH